MSISLISMKGCDIAGILLLLWAPLTMSKARYLLGVSYQGIRYCGWQPTETLGKNAKVHSRLSLFSVLYSLEEESLQNAIHRLSRQLCPLRLTVS